MSVSISRPLGLFWLPLRPAQSSLTSDVATAICPGIFLEQFDASDATVILHASSSLDAAMHWPAHWTSSSPSEASTTTAGSAVLPGAMGLKCRIFVAMNKSCSPVLLALNASRQAAILAMPSAVSNCWKHDLVRHLQGRLTSSLRGTHCLPFRLRPRASDPPESLATHTPSSPWPTPCRPTPHHGFGKSTPRPPSASDSDEANANSVMPTGS